MKLEKVLTYQKGRSPQKDFVSDNLILYLTPEYLRGNGLPTFISDFPSKVSVEDGDLLLLWDGSNAGEFFKGRKGFLSSTMVKFKFNEEEYQREFLYYQLKAFEGYLKAQTRGSGIPHVDRELLLGIEVEKFDKSEQTRIAQILSTADKAIAQTEALIAKYQRIKTGLMHDLLTRGIDEHGRIRSKETHRFVVKNGIEVPEEWEVKTIKDFAKITTGASDTQDRDVAGQYPFFVRSQTVEKSNRYIFDGEGVLTSGDGVGVGKIYHYFNGKFDFHQRVYLIYDFTGNYILGKYFYYYFRENFYNEVSKYSAKTTVDSVRMNMIADMLMPIPIISEQIKIVQILDKIEEFIQKKSVELKKLHSLKTGLMQDLLSGRVRVKVAETEHEKEQQNV